jgi:hypothetical protein
MYSMYIENPCLKETIQINEPKAYIIRQCEIDYIQMVYSSITHRIDDYWVLYSYSRRLCFFPLRWSKWLSNVPCLQDSHHCKS